LGVAARAGRLKKAGDAAAATPNAEAFARNSRRVILPSLNMLSSFSKVFMIFLLSPAKQPCSVLWPRDKMQFFFPTGSTGSGYMKTK
jgi:hypothetical protein